MRRALVVCCALLGAARLARAQSGPPSEGGGAVELVLPTGARALGMGQAAVAGGSPGEAVWWNPALIARGVRQGALHFAQTIATADSGSDFALSVLLPVQRVGTFAVTARRISYGVQEVTDRADPNTIGEFSTTVRILGATFAPTFGDRLSAGLTYKVLQYVFSCSGNCQNTPARSQPTSAFDFGAAYRVSADSTLFAGVAIRNLGLPLQVHDAPQADPLPSRIDIGVMANPKLSQLPPDAQLRIAADVVNRLEPRIRLGYRAGAELSWKNQVQVRAGYVLYGPTGTSTGSLGAGYSTRQFQLDFAALISVSESVQSPPIFLSVRYSF